MNPNLHFESILTKEHFHGKTPCELDKVILSQIDKIPLDPSDIKQQLKSRGIANYLDSVIDIRVKRYNNKEITPQDFAGKEPDTLDIIILSELNDNPLRTVDIRRRLDEDGIPGYSDADIKERLEFYTKLSEAVLTHHGYIRYNETLEHERLLGVTFELCRRPKQEILNRDLNPHHRSYIEDGVSTDRCKAIPVPKGSRVFVCIYCYYSHKGHSAHFSHIYAYRYKDGPIQPIDYWAHISEEI